MKVIYIIALILLLGALFIISNENIHLTESGEAYTFGKHFYSWIVGIIGNAFKITGQAITFEWIPNSNNTTS